MNKTQKGVGLGLLLFCCLVGAFITNLWNFCGGLSFLGGLNGGKRGSLECGVFTHKQTVGA